MQEAPREDGPVGMIYVFPKGVERGMPGGKFGWAPMEAKKIGIMVFHQHHQGMKTFSEVF